jgi:HSP20 family protein
MSRTKREVMETTTPTPTTVEMTREAERYVPAADIFETQEGLEVIVDLPGVAVDGLQVRLENDLLRIYGHVTTPGESGRLLYREFPEGDFYRAFTLEGEFDRESIEAHLRNGVLRLTIPKAPEAKPRRIQVATGG